MSGISRCGYDGGGGRCVLARGHEGRHSLGLYDPKGKVTVSFFGVVRMTPEGERVMLNEIGGSESVALSNAIRMNRLDKRLREFCPILYIAEFAATEFRRIDLPEKENEDADNDH